MKSLKNSIHFYGCYFVLRQLTSFLLTHASEPLSLLEAYEEDRLVHT
jgi:hypothetical protein